MTGIFKPPLPSAVSAFHEAMDRAVRSHDYQGFIQAFEALLTAARDLYAAQKQALLEGDRSPSPDLVRVFQEIVTVQMHFSSKMSYVEAYTKAESLVKPLPSVTHISDLNAASRVLVNQRDFVERANQVGPPPPAVSVGPSIR